MKLKLTKPEPGHPAGAERRWPGYLWGGRVRTSTVALIIAFAGIWWVYDTYQTEVTPPAAPQVVPPGFIPDPAYTWVPRTRLQQPPVTITSTITPTPTTTAEPAPTELPAGEPPAPTPVPGFPFCPPLCPPPAQPEHPEPGPPLAGAPIPPAPPEAPPASPAPPVPPPPPGAPTPHPPVP